MNAELLLKQSSIQFALSKELLGQPPNLPIHAQKYNEQTQCHA